jgi:glycosyltransferase involved in cell wall biosynthesis
LRVLLCKGRFAGPISGADETLMAYATQLKAAGVDVKVAVLYPASPHDPYFLRLRRAGVPVSCIARNSPLGRAMQFLKRRVPHLPAGPRQMLQKAAGRVSMHYVDLCKKYFERSGADVVHVMTPDPAVMAMIRAAHDVRIPVLYQELGTPDFLPELNVYYEMLAEVLPLCDEVAALSPELARRFSEKFARPSPVSVLPILVEEPPPAARAAPHGVTFGFAARMEYGKAPRSLVEAFASVYGRVGAASLRMAGGGPQQPEVELHARALALDGRCSFVGTYSGAAERSAFMRGIDVFVLPSLAEGTPNGIIEAMAHGLPVIASAVGGIPDAVSADMAILVAPGDVTALADAMTRLAQDPAEREAMGRAARRRYEQMFSPSAVLPMLADRYARLTASTPATPLPRHPWAIVPAASAAPPS